MVEGAVPRQMPAQAAPAAAMTPARTMAAPMAQPAPVAQTRPVAQTAPMAPMAPAAPMPTTGVAAEGTAGETEAARLNLGSQALAAAGSDPRALTAIYNDQSLPQSIRYAAADTAMRQMQFEQGQKKVQAKVQEAVQNNDMRGIEKLLKQPGDTGSIAKAFMYSLIGFKSGAEAEIAKMNLPKEWKPVTDERGQTAGMILYSTSGMPLKGIKSDGDEMEPKELIKLSSAKKGIDIVGGTYVNDTTGEVGRVVTDKITGVSYVQTDKGIKPMTGFRPQSSGGTLDMQRVAQIQRQNVELAGDWAKLQIKVQGAGPEAANKYLGEFNAKFGMNVPLTSVNGAPPQISLETGQVVGVAPAAARPAAAAPAAVAPAEPTAPTAPAAARPAPVVPVAPAAVAPAAPATTAPLATQRPAPVAAAAAVPAVGGRATPSQVETAAALTKKAGEEAIQTGEEVKRAQLKPPAEAKGKVEVKTIQEQDTANRSYPVMQEVNQILTKSTGSGIGAAVDDLARVIGASPDGAQVIAQLQPLAGRLVSYVPRFEGAQSDRDVIEYRRQAGDFANPKLPVKERLAALKGLATLMKIYDKEGKNDWGSLTPSESLSPAEKARAELKKRREGQK
jgi:hypothetical protein